MHDGPILLVRGGVMPASTDQELRRLKPQRIVVLGGPGSVGDSLAASLAAYTSGSVSRYWGADRYGAALDISRRSFASAETIYVASGRVFPDALSGGPVAAMTVGPLLLVPGTSLPDGFAAEVQRLGATRAVILGGPGSVSTDVEQQIAALIGS
jgi:putative cell wall-binding protein